MSKILKFPYRFEVPDATKELCPDGKRQVARLLIQEAAMLLKSTSDRDAVIAELIEDCLKLSVQQLDEAAENDLIAF